MHNLGDNSPVQSSESTQDENGQTVLETKKTRQQLEAEVVNGLCQTTGTKDFLADDRLLHQVANALNYPKIDKTDALLRASGGSSHIQPKTSVKLVS